MQLWSVCHPAHLYYVLSTLTLLTFDLSPSILHAVEEEAPPSLYCNQLRIPPQSFGRHQDPSPTVFKSPGPEGDVALYGHKN